MFGCNYNISTFILANESTGQIKYRTGSKSAPGMNISLPKNVAGPEEQFNTYSTAQLYVILRFLLANVQYLSIILIIHQSFFVECDCLRIVSQCCGMFRHLTTYTESTHIQYRV